MHLTLAGFGTDLTALAPDRITVVPTLDEALPVLEAHAADVTAAMAVSGVSSVLEGRALGVNPEAWTPHYLISAVAPSPRQRSRLAGLARTSRAAAAGYLVAGDVPGATWTWEVTPEGRLLAGVLGFDVQAQLTPARQHQALVDLFTVAGQREGVPLAAPSAQAAPPEQLEPGGVLPVDIAILGPASVRAPGVLEPDRAALITELVVYLAVHPGGVHPNVLSAALWPRGVAAEVRDAAVARAAQWLGADGIGRPHLAADASGRLRLGTGVRVDWQVFQALAGHAELAPPGSAEEADYLARALDLVRGQLLAEQPGGAGPLAGTPGWPPTTSTMRSARGSPMLRIGWPYSGWPPATRRGRWTPRGPGSGWRLPTRCSGAICSGPRTRRGRRTSCAPWWRRYAPGRPAMRSFSGWPRRRSPSSTTCTRPGGPPSCQPCPRDLVRPRRSRSGRGAGEPGVDAGQQAPRHRWRRGRAAYRHPGQLGQVGVRQSLHQPGDLVLGRQP